MSASIKTGGAGTIKTSSNGNAQVYTMNPEFEKAVGFISDASFSIRIANDGSFEGGQFYNENTHQWESISRGVALQAYEYPWGYGLYFRGTQNKQVSKGSTSWQLNTDGKIICRGNIKYLLQYNATNKIDMPDSAFYWMFAEWDNLIAAPQFPTDNEVTISSSCYSHMFYHCKSLEVTPILSSTNLSNSCYFGMFYACENLKYVTPLPATSLPQGCYWSMFQNCTNLKTIPNLSQVTSITGADAVFNMFTDSITIERKPNSTHSQPYKTFTNGSNYTNDAGNYMFGAYSVDPGETVYIDPSIVIV